MQTDWFTANIFCRYHGLQLASVETAEQNAYIGKLIVENGESHFLNNKLLTLNPNYTNYTKCLVLGYGSEFFWTSGADLHKEGDWTWYSSGNKFQYKDWHPNQPDNANKNENCMHIWNNQKWNDAPCTNQYYFICEIPLCK